VDALRRSDLPFALIGRTADNTGLSFVDVDVDAAVDICVEHLVGLGHRRIALLRQVGDQGGNAARAAQAYELACARRRLRLVTAGCGPTVDAAIAATAALLQEHGDVTGIVAWSEWAGWGSRMAAGFAGRAVPDDLSIICLGQGSAAEMLPFEPTRVDLLPGELAGRAVRLLIAQLEGEQSAEEQVLLQPELIIGATTGPVSQG
jgi:DNA-binding LacI/PurR family transcriptional regulator